MHLYPSCHAEVKLEGGNDVRSSRSIKIKSNMHETGDSQFKFGSWVTKQKVCASKKFSYIFWLHGSISCPYFVVGTKLLKLHILTLSFRG